MMPVEEENYDVSSLGVFSCEGLKRPWFDPGEAASLCILAY